MYSPLSAEISLKRYTYEEKYTPEFFELMIPKNLPRLKESFIELMKKISASKKTSETWGMLHYDYGDGNYSIDYVSGKITVYDFDNCCYGPFMYDIASMWRNGVGWRQFEKDAEKRRAFMDAYFAEVIRGYRSETELSDGQLSLLPLYLEAVQMENIMDEFELAHSAGEEPHIDKSLAYMIKCAQDGIPFQGYFSDVYSPEAPFEYEGEL
ncbi:MAG: phosphotransferase [Eubacteriales bacterium]|nr:phosphotransferase [Eubacteriales bacterium]MDD3881288.1 phosphotransferase [Eubacteriales bacterium]MDD4512206.1 phosphotransferase [Eubacteriales bacterium]